MAIFHLAVIMGDVFSLKNTYSCCSKAPNWEEMPKIMPVPVIMPVIMGLIGLGMQIAILLKLKKVESQPTNAPWDISYDTRDGVIIARLPSLTSHCKTWRHSRNLVSPIGSCVSFIVCQIWMLVTSYYIFNISPSGPGIVHDFLLFMAPSRDFFLVNFIGTICSPTLTKSLFESIQFGLI